MAEFDTNQDLRIDVTHFGNNREPVLIIDNFLANPRSVVNAAGRATWNDAPPGGYPGIRAGLPREYVRSVLRRMDEPIKDTLLGPNTSLDTFSCSYSMVTRAPADLTAQQKVPHIDVANPLRIAVLQYLCAETFGGTAFFRQNATGLEQISPKTRAQYQSARRSELEHADGDISYPSAETHGYTRTGFVAARFNRLIAYRSCTLHSGIIDDPNALSDDPKTGRLTANFFVDYSLADNGETSAAKRN